MVGSSYQKIYEIVMQIPAGKVASYGQIAFIAGWPRGARRVGYALYRCPDPLQIPWHRVVYKDGSLPPDDITDRPGRQRALLEAEGIIFDAEGRVDMARYRWGNV